jgi:hypothetical protein
VANVSIEPHVAWATIDAMLLTVARHGVEHYRLRLPSSAREVGIRDGRRSGGGHMQLLAIVVADGISLKGPGGNIAPGCTEMGAGLAIGRTEGVYDFDALGRCVAKLHAESGAALESVEVWASPETDFDAIASTIEIVARDYPRITLLL